MSCCNAWSRIAFLIIVGSAFPVSTARSEPAATTPPINVAAYSGQHAYFNPQQRPFRTWKGAQSGRVGPACFNYAFPPSDGHVMANPLPHNLPPGWRLLPPHAPLRYGDRILFGLDNVTLHSAVVWRTKNGIATWVQQIPGPGAPVVCSNPQDPMLIESLVPFAAVRPPHPEMQNCLFPENAVNKARATVYTEATLQQWYRRGNHPKIYW